MKRFLLPAGIVALLCALPAKAQQPSEQDSVRMYELQQIEVTATRATRQTPVAYANLSREEIARKNFGHLCFQIQLVYVPRHSVP